MYDYEDYYNEPNEFEEQIEEFKNSLYDCVKQEHKDKMDRLIKENNALKEVKKNFNKIELEYEKKTRELVVKIQTAERDAKRLRLNDLMQELKQPLWKPHTIMVYGEKCDKCDDNRKIHFISPSGKDMIEDCDCAKMFAKYVPIKCELYEFRQNNNSITKWYKREEDYDYYYSSFCVKTLIKEEKDFKSIDRSYSVFFTTEELCQKYCDIINKENGITEDMSEER